MNALRLAAASIATTPLDWEGNLEVCRRAVAEARRLQVDILCLPELCISGYGCEDAFLSPHVARAARESVLALAADCRGILVAAGFPLRLGGRLHNAVALVGDGRVQGISCKRHLARDGVHYEPRWFAPWPAGSLEEDPEWDCPIGDQLFDWHGVRIGFEICEDAWALNRPAQDWARGGVDIVLGPSASHFSFGKHATRERLVLEGSRMLSAGYAYANLLGNEAGRIVYDGGAMVASGGRLLARSQRLSFRGLELAAADLDLDTLRMRRSTTSHPVPGPAPVVTPVTAPGLPEQPGRPTLPAPADPAPLDKNGEFARAAALALWDYLRKSRAQGYVLSLSGGADSAACAVLIRCLGAFALADLGEDGVQQALAHLALPPAPLDAGLLVGRILHCAYQSTRNSGPVTLAAARKVAAGTGARFHLWDVDAMAEGYRALVEGSLGHPLSWEANDLALQNIQARVRAPSVWLLANATGCLLMSTSNRSEMAVGYATMDGDTSGGIAPLAGIDKAFLLGWLSWMEREGPAETGAMPFLAAITAQAPTAELRPTRDGQAQTDEGDLMPYPLLDAIERLAIVERKSPAECWEALRRVPGTDPETLSASVERFFTLWARNQWKRERYAPSFHLDEHNLDPRSWCRFPILSGGFRRELAELRRKSDSPS